MPVKVAYTPLSVGEIKPHAPIWHCFGRRMPDRHRFSIEMPKDESPLPGCFRFASIEHEVLGK